MSSPGDRVLPLTANYLKDVLFALEGCTLNQRKQFLQTIQTQREDNREKGVVYQRPTGTGPPRGGAPRGGDRPSRNKEKYLPKKGRAATTPAEEDEPDGQTPETDEEVKPVKTNRAKLSLKI